MKTRVTFEDCILFLHVCISAQPIRSKKKSSSIHRSRNVNFEVGTDTSECIKLEYAECI